MGDYHGVSEPWKMISADLMGPFRRSLNGNKYLLVITDSFSKFLLKPLRAATTKAISTNLKDDIFLVYGVPKYIIFDNGSEFIGKAVKKLADPVISKTITQC